MPTYQYRCAECGKAFERTETISEHEKAKPQCPKCGSKKVCPGETFHSQVRASPCRALGFGPQYGDVE